MEFDAIALGGKTGGLEGGRQGQFRNFVAHRRHILMKT